MEPHKYHPKVGDIITTSGTGFTSATINIGTFGLPGRNASHIGIVTDVDGRLMVVESTSVLPSSSICEIAGKPVKGVQVHTLESVVNRPGRCWAHPLTRPLYSHEDQRLRLYLLSRLGQPYDMIGAFRSGGFLFNRIQSVLRPEDLATLFCSELVASALCQAGLFHTRNASRWNPNKLVRALRHEGLVRPKLQIQFGDFPRTPPAKVSTNRR